jgi:hypothetical protein
MSDPTLTLSDDYFLRKKDGYRVRAGYWSDGDVSWIFDPLMVIAPGGFCGGTMKGERFRKLHTPAPEPTHD